MLGGGCSSTVHQKDVKSVVKVLVVPRAGIYVLEAFK